MKNPADIIETFLPVFPGFYGSIFGDGDSDAEYCEVEHLFESAGIDYRHAGKIAELATYNGDLYAVDYSTRFFDYAREICDAIGAEICRLFPAGINRVEFQELRSPREYNFANDAINIELHTTGPDARAFRAELLRMIRKNRAAFADFIRKRYTSGPGFWSSYSNDPADWIKDIRTGAEALDGHKAGALLEFVFQCEDFTEYDLYEVAESPGYIEYMSGPLIDLLENIGARDFPPAVVEILDTLDKGRAQLKKYEQSGVSANAVENQRAGFIKNESKLIAAACEELAAAAE